MTIFFAFTFLLGLVAAVYFLVRGVERRTREPNRAQIDRFGREWGAGNFAVGAPVVAAFLLAMGLAGYAAARLGATRPVRPLGIGVAVGLLASVLTARVVIRWAAYATVHDTPDERFVLQGHVATVTRGGSTDLPGEIEYTANGRRVVAPARNVTRSPLTAGSEVVIDRLEDGVAYVEAWTRVEERL